MNQLRKFIACATLTTAMLSVLASPAAAQVTKSLQNGLQAAGGNAGYTSGGTTDLKQIVGALISEALGLLGVVLLAILIYAGFLWMTAQGDDTKVKKAKDMIFQAVIGLIIIVAAYAIADFVIVSLGNATSGGTGGEAGGGTGNP